MAAVWGRTCIVFGDRTEPANREKQTKGWVFPECFPASGGFGKRKVRLTRRERGNRGSSAEAAEAVRSGNCWQVA